MAWEYSDYKEPDEVEEARCPMCGNICYKVFHYKNEQEILGCNECIEEEDADDCDECFGGGYGE